LTGSAWDEYSLHQTVGGYWLPKGLRPYQALPFPVFTPSKKVDYGHDESLDENEARELVGDALYKKLRDYSMTLYAEASAYLIKRSLILADTKFEFGLVGDQIIWIDEALTPDSSRYWDLNDYLAGKEPINYDKQIVRDYLKSLGNRWDNTPIELPVHVIKSTQERYITAWEKITGKRWACEPLEFKASSS
jgi:phosphoribosylaminoimidazole-succinocarboxamide synthase